MTDETHTPEEEPQQDQEALRQEALREEGEPTLKAFVRHQREGYNEVFQAIESLLPEGFVEHTQNAGKAFIRSFRVLTEGLSEGIEKAKTARAEKADSGDEGRTTSTGKAKVKVEVS